MSARLEDLAPGVTVHGVVSGQAVTTVGVEWHGASCVTLTYRSASGAVGHQLVYRSDEARLEVDEESPAAALLYRSRQWADEARNLAYWLSVTAAARGRSKDVLDCDALLASWPGLARLAEQLPEQGEQIAMGG